MKEYYVFTRKGLRWLKEITKARRGKKQAENKYAQIKYK